MSDMSEIPRQQTRKHNQRCIIPTSSLSFTTRSSWKLNTPTCLSEQKEEELHINLASLNSQPETFHRGTEWASAPHDAHQLSGLNIYALARVRLCVWEVVQICEWFIWVAAYRSRHLESSSTESYSRPKKVLLLHMLCHLTSPPSSL